ncbi:UNVERIFIED_CONTAM: hypothetical protein FKN15_065506 [Acipenser sinensis]
MDFLTGHDGQPYCHKPCYATLFGPKGLFLGSDTNNAECPICQGSRGVLYAQELGTQVVFVLRCTGFEKALSCQSAEAYSSQGTEDAEAPRHRGYGAPGPEATDVGEHLNTECAETQRRGGFSAPRMPKHRGTEAMEHRAPKPPMSGST